MLPEIETPYIKLWMEDGILFGKYAENLFIDLEIAKQVVHERIKFSKGISYPVIIDMKGVRSANKQAREYLATEGAKYVTAGALVVDSAVTRTLGNIFLTVNKPPLPTKLFTNEAEAKEWIKQYL